MKWGIVEKKWKVLYSKEQGARASLVEKDACQQRSGASICNEFMRWFRGLGFIGEGLGLRWQLSMSLQTMPSEQESHRAPE